VPGELLLDGHRELCRDRSEGRNLRRPRTLTLDPALRWTRLTVLQTRDGGLFDNTGTVQFRAMYVRAGQRGVLAETSRFVRQNRHWTYLGPID
jgi:uncharacterized protein YchJ